VRDSSAVPSNPSRRRRAATATVALAFAVLGALPATAAAAEPEFPVGREGYHTYGEMRADVAAVAAAHPEIVS